MDFTPLMTCYPTDAASEVGCAEEVLTAFARRAYRRPLTPEDVRSLLAAYHTGRAEDDVLHELPPATRCCVSALCTLRAAESIALSGR